MFTSSLASGRWLNERASAIQRRHRSAQRFGVANRHWDGCCARFPLRAHLTAAREPRPPCSGGAHLITNGMWIEAAAIFAAVYGTAIAIMCVPIWLLLIRFRLAGWISAAALGLIASLIAWADVQSMSSDMHFWLVRALVYGPCGAVAGFVTWWASPLRRQSTAPLPSNSESSTGA